VRRLGHIARTANNEALGLHRKIDARPLDSGKIDTDPNAFVAAIRVDRRLPGVRPKPGKLQTRQLGCHIMKRAVQPAQFDGAVWIHDKINFDRVRSVFNRGDNRMVFELRQRARAADFALF
jgi:hypothetical protein